MTEATEAELVAWPEHKRVADLRKGVLRPMHKDRLLDFDETARTIRLLPPVPFSASSIRDSGQNRVGRIPMEAA